MFTIVPLPAFWISGAAAWITRKVPVRFTATVRENASAVVSAIPVSARMPAALMTPSSPPIVSAALLTAALCRIRHVAGDRNRTDFIRNGLRRVIGPVEDRDRRTFPPEQPGSGAHDTRCAPGNDDLASRQPCHRCCPIRLGPGPSKTASLTAACQHIQGAVFFTAMPLPDKVAEGQAVLFRWGVET